MNNYYQVLGVSRTASGDEIKAAYRFLALALHPDRFPGTENKARAEARFKEVAQAYHVLRNPGRRRAYDWHFGMAPGTIPAVAADADAWKMVIRQVLEKAREIGLELLDDYKAYARDILRSPRSERSRRRK